MPPLDHPILSSAIEHQPLLVVPRVAIRPIGPDDAAKLAAFFRGLSPRSRTRRFHGGMNEPPPDLLAQLSRSSDANSAALVAVAGSDGFEKIVGEARYAVEYARDAEFAIVVDDAMQGCGLGKRLLRRLVHLASNGNVRRLYGDVQADNKPMLVLAHALGFVQRLNRADTRLQRVERHFF